MKSKDIIEYYDYLMRLAMLKCNLQADAEDLVNDTMLAAFDYIHSGKKIEYPKTWLATTLYHKYNDMLRKKYRAPVTVYLDERLCVYDEEDNCYITSEEAAKVRKELNYLAHITREVLIRFYYGNQSVAAIAKSLGIPEGTVKSRLNAGRSQIKKGLKTMEIKENYLPGHLYLSFGGEAGLKNEPVSLVENDLIAQNLLIIAYEKPLTITELSRTIGIPAAYIEPVANKLADGELMIKTEGGKYYSDFIITNAREKIESFKPQLNFAHEHFNVIWNIVAKMSESITNLECIKKLSQKQKIILDRYTVLKVLQDFGFFGTGKIKAPDFPERKDGGHWFASAVSVNAGEDTETYNKVLQYVIHGGHRRTHDISISGTKEIILYEFDTTLWDSPHRFGGAVDMYFKYIIPLLWRIHMNMPLNDSDIPNEFISYMPHLEAVGLIGYNKDKVYVKIPVIQKCDYDEIITVIHSATEEIKSAVGNDFEKFITSMKAVVPKHLKSVPELFRFKDATEYFVMSIVREAYEKGLHLKGVDYCCPPAVLVYEK